MRLCMQRKSIRKYIDKEVPDAAIQALMESAMQAPSARNQQPWDFIVIKNRSLLKKLSQVSRGAWPLAGAPLGILTLMRDDSPADHMLPQDLAAATHNILLEATYQGLGAVWIGVYPLEERLENLKTLIDIPDGKTPFSMIAVGYPDEPTEVTNIRYDASRVTVIE